VQGVPGHPLISVPVAKLWLVSSGGGFTSISFIGCVSDWSLLVHAAGDEFMSPLGAGCTFYLSRLPYRRCLQSDGQFASGLARLAFLFRPDEVNYTP